MRTIIPEKAFLAGGFIILGILVLFLVLGFFNIQLPEIQKTSEGNLDDFYEDYKKYQSETKKELERVQTYLDKGAPLDETGKLLTLPAGFRISLFAKSLGPIRFMAFSPDGILFITKPSDAGLFGSNTSGGAVFALPDKNGDEKADEIKTVISNLMDRPHGIAFHDGYLYLAEESTVSRYTYLGDGDVGKRETIITGLPSGGGHVSRTIQFSSSGKMYVSVGSSCNICKESDMRRAAIVEYSPDGTGERVFAEGLRNAVGFVFHPDTDEVWATENGRDFLGDNLPPDEINIARDKKHYGWPQCYGKKIVDPKFNDADFCAVTESSAYDIQAHSAPLGLRFIQSSQFPEEWQGDLLVAYHGSWNKNEPTGYKIARLDVENNMIIGEEDFISGWLARDGTVTGRPVDLIFGPDGALYISDDKEGVIYLVTNIMSGKNIDNK